MLGIVFSAAISGAFLCRLSFFTNFSFTLPPNPLP
jgi:hypothetical protein